MQKNKKLLKTGFRKLDRLLTGLHPGLYVIASRPSIGKTSLAVNILRHAVLARKSCAIVFSLELYREMVEASMLAQETQIPTQLIRDGNLSEKQKRKYSKCQERIRNSQLIIDDEVPCRINDIREKCRRISEKQKPDLIVIDYCQLIDYDDPAERFAHEQELHDLAREFGVPVLVTSQLSRTVCFREDKRPKMSDMRAGRSGSVLQQSADVILLLYRDECYHQNREWKGIAEVEVAKNRYGKLGTVCLAFDKETTGFRNCRKRVTHERL